MGDGEFEPSTSALSIRLWTQMTMTYEAKPAWWKAVDDE
jgi:hypothetical protein